jgi:hypothetical protein
MEINHSFSVGKLDESGDPQHGFLSSLPRI